ncbi:MAG: YccF domain-containing protein, partial [Eubacterium sp.]|nr:YccF domain-containing protein [Eubacterium sp.]
MRLLGNIIWFIFGGFISGMAWVVSGILWCITVIGIPYGLQCFKFATMSFCPFGRRIEYGGGVISFLVNVVWFLLNGWWMALVNFLIGCLWCVTIIGIPFGKQFFKIAKLALRPFGAYIVNVQRAVWMRICKETRVYSVFSSRKSQARGAFPLRFSAILPEAS